MEEKIKYKPKKMRKNIFINTDPVMDDGVVKEELLNSFVDIVKELYNSKNSALEETSKLKKKHHQLFTKENKVMIDKRFKIYKPRNEDLNYFSNLLDIIEDVERRFQDDPYNREFGTDSLTAIYKNDTPGQTEKTNEVTIRTAEGKMKRLANVPIRMASGEIKSMPPGKSGSSGGGGCGG